MTEIKNMQSARQFVKAVGWAGAAQSGVWVESLEAGVWRRVFSFLFVWLSQDLKNKPIFGRNSVDKWM